MTTEPCWPDPLHFSHVYHGETRHYRSKLFPRDLPGVTSVLKVLGLATEGLIKWSADTERLAVLEAAQTVYESIAPGHAYQQGEFARAVEMHIGPARANEKLKQKGQDIGSEIHDHIEWQLLREMGEVRPEPEIRDEALLASMAFEENWRDSGLQIIRVEQPIWHVEHLYAGTIDQVVMCPRRGLGLRDMKSSKGVFLEMHLQLAAYVEAARSHGFDIQWAEFVRLPKRLDDPILRDGGVEIRALGDCREWDNKKRCYIERKRTQEGLFRAFRAALVAWMALQPEDA